MKNVFTTGRYLFALALIGFGMIQLITGNLPSEFMPFPANMPGKIILALITGLIFISSGICIFANKLPRSGAVASGIVFFLFLLYPHSVKLLSNVHNPSEWVAFLETLCFSSIALTLASTLPTDKFINAKWSNALNKCAVAGKYLFAIAIIIFGIQHFMYEKFIISLVPLWIPFKIFWLYLVKAGFILTGISIIFNFQTKLGLILLGIMFLSWILILHGPRVAATPKIEPEWTSFFVALAMCSGCFILTSQTKKKVTENNTVAYSI
jgi:uncharacterized membrane protein